MCQYPALSGENVENLLSGKPNKRYPYGVFLGRTLAVGAAVKGARHLTQEW